MSMAPMIGPLFPECTISSGTAFQITSNQPSVTFHSGLTQAYIHDFLRKMAKGLIQIKDKDGIELIVRMQ
jgi:hypothetical protein